MINLENNNIIIDIVQISFYQWFLDFNQWSSQTGTYYLLSYPFSVAIIAAIVMILLLNTCFSEYGFACECAALCKYVSFIIAYIF